MRYLILSLLFCSHLAVLGISQTYLAPVVGTDLFQTYIEQGREPGFGLSAEKEDIRFVPIFGVALQQQVVNRFSLSFNLMYTRKDFNMRDWGFSGYSYSRSHIRHWDYSIMAKYNIWKGLHIGVGCTYSNIDVFYYILEDAPHRKRSLLGRRFHSLPIQEFLAGTPAQSRREHSSYLR